MRQLPTLAIAGLIIASCVETASVQASDSPRFDNQFWNHWGDGKAELAGYDLTYSRYGEARKGRAVTIFVTETFSDSERVKADPGRHPKDDEYPVIKLNLVQDFKTGIYDYNLMTSAFVQLAKRNGHPAGVATKVSFSAQEWCGHAYQQVLFDRSKLRITSHSYFDGEGDESATLPYADDGMSADTLHLWARGLAGPEVAPGNSRSVPILRSLERARLDHEPLEWIEGSLSRQQGVEKLEVPAGSFEVRQSEAKIGALTMRFWIETKAPHRIVAWESSRGDRAVLRGSKRLPYWKLNTPSGEKALESLGFPSP